MDISHAAAIRLAPWKRSLPMGDVQPVYTGENRDPVSDMVQM